MKQIKLKLCFILVALMALSSSVFAANRDRAVEISIGGIGPGVDQTAISLIRQVVGTGVANAVIDKFIVNNDFIAIEGGLTACAEASPSTKAFPRFVRQLKAIKPNPNTTAYSVRLVPTCNDVPVSTPIACKEDAKICPDGSAVGRVPPSCQFAPCPGEK